MPWKVSDPVSERLKFISRLLDGERMSDLCGEFGISRKTGYKLLRRYDEKGARGLYDRSRRPNRSPQRTTQDVAARVIGLRKRYATWGPKKLRRRLQDLDPEVRWPAASTIGVLIKDAGLVDGRKRRRRAWPTPPSERCTSTRANELWSIDFKGHFRMGNGRYCYPLTVSDHFSRFLLGCEALECTRVDPAALALEAVFRDYGLPERMRSDNGAPFASTGFCGLTRLSVWLLRLGIQLERVLEILDGLFELTLSPIDIRDGRYGLAVIGNGFRCGDELVQCAIVVAKTVIVIVATRQAGHRVIGVERFRLL